jgi:hypothetical protein
MNANIKKLNRFTTLPFVIDMLRREKLTLLNPLSWEDYNDRKTLEVYKAKSGFESVYVLCLTHENETIHHWNSYASGTAGCCVEFSPFKLFASLERHNDIMHGKMDYISVRDLREYPTESIPFLKRLPYRPEREYRIIASGSNTQTPAFDIDIDLASIRRITLSGKLPNTTFNSIKNMLYGINPNFKGKISHSTLYSNPQWIGHFD